MAANSFHTKAELEELGKRADDVYVRLVKPKLRPEDNGKFVAVDVNTGEYEIDEDDYAAMTRLEARLPDAEIWLQRAGCAAAYNLPGLQCWSDE